MVLGLFLATGILAQVNDTTSFSKWEHSASLNFYFFQDPFIFLPTYDGNKGHLHLAARYNYEDIRTFSGWVGYNFMGGNHLEYVITPMIGGLVGRTNGFACGALIQLDFRKFSFYSESEYVFDVVAYDNDYFSNYFYTWTDISYNVIDQLSIGMSAQKTRIYQQDDDIQRGFLISVNAQLLDITGYFYSPFTKEPFFILTLSRDF
jgi:hypothetical protein